MNKFFELLDLARQQRWCVSPDCTTCGAMEYRQAIQNLGGNALVRALSTMDIGELGTYPNWQDAIRIALGEIHAASDMDVVLGAWLFQVQENIRLADVVLFYFVRLGALFAPMGVDTLRRWREACISLALKTHDESLLESLVYTLGKGIEDQPELWMLVKTDSQNSKRLTDAIKRTVDFVL